MRKQGKTRNQIRAAKLRQQRLMGFLVLMICAVVFAVASAGSTIIDKDSTVAVLLAPLGLYLLLTKRIVIV